MSGSHTGAWPVMGDWFSQNLRDPGLQSLARTDFNRDLSLTRGDVLGLLTRAEADGTVSTTEVHDLQTLVAWSGTLAIPPDVTNLADKVVNGDPANALYHWLDSSGDVQTTSLGNLHAGSSSDQLAHLVGKWFWGANEPVSASGHPYRAVDTGVPLTVGGFHYYDVTQRAVADCWLMASLAEVAARTPAYLQGMFAYDGTTTLNGATVGVWTVRFFRSGVPDYVTVDTALPDGGSYYGSITSTDPDGTTSTQLWAALAEKAYAQENESGWIGAGSPGVDSYQALDIGWPAWALQALTGLPTADISGAGDDIAAAWIGGKLIALGTVPSPTSTQIVPAHSYAVVGYDPSSSSPFALYNPLGLNGITLNGEFKPGLVTATASFLARDFNLATLCGAIPPAGGAPPGSSVGTPGRHPDGTRQPALTPGRADRTDLTDPGLATIRRPRDESLPALYGTVAGHSKHAHAGGAWLFAEDDRDSW